MKVNYKLEAKKSSNGGLELKLDANGAILMTSLMRYCAASIEMVIERMEEFDPDEINDVVFFKVVAERNACAEINNKIVTTMNEHIEDEA